MRKLLYGIPLFWGCSSSEPSLYERLTEYEGHYEYINESGLDLIVSELDTTLYAVIDQAKYPLTHLTTDSFANNQDTLVVFQRNPAGEVMGYTSENQYFSLLSRDFDKMETLPRRALFGQAEKYKYTPPPNTGDGLSTGSVYEAFSDPGPILDMVKKTIAGEFPEVHSLLIYKDGALVLEEYFYGYQRDTPHQLRSATKSFIGSLLGIAIQQDMIRSEEELLLPFFDHLYDTVEALDSRKRAITLEHFLQYRHGLDCENDNPRSPGNEMAMMRSEDWVRFTLDLPMVTEPGRHTSYCSGCPLVLGKAIEIASGTPLEQFAEQHLFSPLGIRNYRWTFAPDPSSRFTFNQMYLTPRDLMKLALLYLSKGQWQGKTILPEGWAKKTFTAGDGGYGYLWKSKYFTVEGQRFHSFMASGNGGQKINIWPELDMITVFTGGNYNSYLLYGKPTPPNEMIHAYILKALL